MKHKHIFRQFPGLLDLDFHLTEEDILADLLYGQDR